MEKELELVKSGWTAPETRVISNPKDTDVLFLEVWTEKMNSVTCDAYPAKAVMKIYSKEYVHLREYITKNAPKRISLCRTDGGSLCIMIDITY